MSPSVANVVVQIAAESRANGHPATEERVIERLKRLGFSEADVRSVLTDAEALGIVRSNAQQLVIVGAE